MENRSFFLLQGSGVYRLLQTDTDTDIDTETNTKGRVLSHSSSMIISASIQAKKETKTKSLIQIQFSPLHALNESVCSWIKAKDLIPIEKLFEMDMRMLRIEPFPFLTFFQTKKNHSHPHPHPQPHAENDLLCSSSYGRFVATNMTILKGQKAFESFAFAVALTEAKRRLHCTWCLCKIQPQVKHISVERVKLYAIVQRHAISKITLYMNFSVNHLSV